jgi:hypothetical protein
MINSFRDRETEGVFRRKLSRRLPDDMQRVAYRKLVQLALEARSGNRRGQRGAVLVNLQTRYDLERAADALADRIDHEVQPFAA